MTNKKSTAVFTITASGINVASKIKKNLPDADIHVPRKFQDKAPAGWNIYDIPLTELVREQFHRYDYLVFIISIGAVVRLISPCIEDKHTDPGVVVIDDNAEFVISILSGHTGGANAFTEKIAGLLNAKPVITTASDAGKTIPVDLLGRAFGWKIENYENVTGVSASVVNREPVAFIQEAGEKNWWKGELPENISIFSSLKEIKNISKYSAFLIVTDRIIADEIEDIKDRVVVYMPKSLVCGLGCNRDASFQEILYAVTDTFDKNLLSPASLRNFATIDIKKDEEGLTEISKYFQKPLVYYTKEELNSLKSIPNPSERVREHIGAAGVCEPAAILSSNSRNLLVEKQKYKNVTVALARIK